MLDYKSVTSCKLTGLTNRRKKSELWKFWSFVRYFLKSWSTNLSLGGYNARLFDRFSIVIALCYPKISFAKPTKGYPTASNILDFYFLVWVLPFLAPKGKKKCVKSTSKEQFRGFVYRSLTLIYKGLLTIHTVISSQIPVVIQ